MEPSIEPIVFRAAARAHEVNASRELIDVLQPAFHELRLPYFNVFEAVSDGHSHAERLLPGNPNPSWQAYYIKHRLYKRDYRVRHARSSPAPFFGSEVLVAGSGITDDDRAFAALATGFGLTESYVFPHRSPHSRVFAAIAIGPGREIDGQYRAALLCLTSAFLFAAMRIDREAIKAASGVARYRLTSRQLECLEWSRQGKSSGDIGNILGLSPRTIDEHLAAVCQALGVRTRVQAVAMALTEGLLPYTAPAL